MKNPMQFISEVRIEAAKIVWPARKEAGQTTIMVFLMATVVAIFFFLIDQVLRIGIDFLLSL